MADAPVTGYHVLPVTAIQESTLNPRTHFDAAALGELTDSIRQQGLMVPLLVRPVNGHYEILDGARRFRAAQLAGLDELPVVVDAREDETAREAALVANVQRADVTPLDEARAFGAMLAGAGATREVVAVSWLARRAGKTPQYVWNRLTLLDLVPVAQQLLDAGRLTVAHGIVLARLTVEQQERAIREGLFEHEAALSLLDDEEDDGFFDDEGVLSVAQFTGRKARTARELEAWVARNIRFDVLAAAVVAPLDFGPVADRVLEAQEQPGRGKKVVHVTCEYHVQPEAKGESRTYCHDSWKRADGAHEDDPVCDRSVLGVVVVGAGYGQAFPVCVDKDCEIHWAAEKREREKRAKVAADPKAREQFDRKADEQARKQKEQREREEQARKEWAQAAPAIAKAVAVAVQKAKPMTLAPAALARLWKDRLKALTTQLGAPKTADDVVRLLALSEFMDNLDEYNGPRHLAEMVRPLGVDVAAIVKAANAPAPAATKVAKSKPAKSKPAAAKTGKQRG